MAQGDVRLFKDLAYRVLMGEVSITAKPWIALVGGPKIATPEDANPDISDYDLIVSTATMWSAPLPASSQTIWGLSGASFSMVGQGRVGNGYMPSPISVQLQKGKLLGISPVDYSNWVDPPVPATNHAFIDYFINYIEYPRIPGARQVYQMMIFEKRTDSSPCICYVDLTTDDGTTPYNLDWAPIQIQFGDRVNGYYPFFSNTTRLIFSAEGA